MAGVGIWRVVDPETPATVIFDCNDTDGTSTTLPTGLTSWVRDLILPPPTLRAERISSPAAPGGITAYAHDDLKVIRWKQALIPAGTIDYDDLATAMRELGALLRKGGVIEFTPTDSADTFYIDFEPSPYLGLLLEAGDSHRAMQSHAYPEGIDVEIVCQPFLRKAPVTIVSAVSFDNGALAGDVPFTNPGTAPSPAKVSVKVASATADTAQLILGIRAKRDLTGDDLTEFRAKFQFTPTTPAALTAKWKKIWTQTITPSPLSGFHGTFAVFAALKLDAKDDYEVQLRTSMTNDDPPGNANPVLALANTSGAIFNEFGEALLGYVTFDRDGTHVQLQMWARSDAASAMTWGVVTLVPADEQLILASSPGLRQGKFFRTSFDARTLDFGASGATLADDDSYALLDAVDEFCENDNFILPAGRYYAQMIGRVRNDGLTRTKIGELQILEAGSVVKSADIYSSKRQVWTGYNNRRVKAVTFTANGTDTYKARVRQTHATSTDVEMRVRKLRRWMTPRVRSDDQFVLDATDRKSYIANSSGARKWPLVVEGGLPMLPPGDGVIVARLGDIPVGSGHLESDPRGPLAEAVAARAATMTVVVTPWHPL